MLQQPSAVGLFLCEQVILEEGTRNVTIVNTMSRLRVATFPTDPLRLVVYAVLIDGLGDVTMSLAVSRLDTFEEVREERWQMRFQDPLRAKRLILRLGNLILPAPVRYQFALFADEEVIAQCVLEAWQQETTQ